MTMRKTVTLTGPMTARVSLLAGQWKVSESEVMRRLFGMGSFLADELERDRDLISKDPNNGEEERLVFLDL